MTETPPPLRPPGPEWTAQSAAPAAPSFTPVPPPARRRTAWRTWLIVAGVVAVLCCGLALFGMERLFRGAFNEVASVNSSANSFFRGLVDGSDVYGQLCADAKSAVSRQQFGQQRTDRPPHDYSITNTNVRNVNGQVTATVTVRLRFEAGEETHVVPMASEDGTWKVCGRPY